MAALTAHLKAEHALILEALDLLQEVQARLYMGSEFNPSDLRTLIFLLQGLVETVHHDKEERFLFPALAQTERIGEGGPRCTYFAGLSQQDDLVSQILSELEPEDPGPIPSPYSTQGTAPLQIPLQEHRAGHVALLQIRKELQAYEQDPSRRRILSARISAYDRLLRRHIEKEDTCLFVMADRLLSESQQAEILKKIEHEHGGQSTANQLSFVKMLRLLKISLHQQNG